MKIKRILVTLLLSILAFSQSYFCFADTLAEHEFAKLEHEVEENSKTLHNVIKGGIHYDDGFKDSDLFTGEIEEIEEGAKLKMTVASVVSSGFNQEGDEFFAEVTDDFSTESGIVIPSGTVAHGTVSKLKTSKRLGRDGYIIVNFDFLITPDGRKVPIDASMTTKRHPVT